MSGDAWTQTQVSGAQRAADKHREHADAAVAGLTLAAEVDDPRNDSYGNLMAEAQVHATLAASWASVLIAETHA